MNTACKTNPFRWLAILIFAIATTAALDSAKVSGIFGVVCATAAYGQAFPAVSSPSEVNDLGHCPSSQVGLAPPSGHWIFSQPISSQTKLVTIEVTVLDVENKPVSNADVLAYSEPWDFLRALELTPRAHGTL